MRLSLREKICTIEKGFIILPNGLAMKSSGIETVNYRMRTKLNRITNLALSTSPAIFYSRCCGFVLLFKSK